MPTKGNNGVLNILQKHLDVAKDGCVVSKWIDTLSKEEQEAFKLIREKNEFVSLTAMYKDLSDNQDLPFGCTTFRIHLRGTCTCPKIS